MSGINFCVCSTSIISVLQCALIQLWNDLNTIREKNESQQNRDQWRILLQGRHTHRPRLQQAWGKKCGNQNPWNSIAEKEERSGCPDICTDRLKVSDHSWKAFLKQTAQSGMMTVLVFLKNGKLILRHANDQGNWWNFLENDTKSSIWFLSRGNSSRQNPAIRWEQETPLDRSGATELGPGRLGARSKNIDRPGPTWARSWNSNSTFANTHTHQHQHNTNTHTNTQQPNNNQATTQPTQGFGLAGLTLSGPTRSQPTDRDAWCRFSRRGKASTIRHWKRWSRIGIVNRIKIIRETGEWSSAKKTEKNFKCCSNVEKNILLFGEN